MKQFLRIVAGLLLLTLALTFRLCALEPLRPYIDGTRWTIATNPDLGNLTSTNQQPVDFAIWQAADSSWQLWSCIRGTKEQGKTRLFYHWEANELTQTNWTPMGIAMRAEEKVGETRGGLQAPHVIRNGKTFYMFYGDWENICLATSTDGKFFTRHVNANGKTALFTEGAGNNTRDPMVIRIGNLWHCYYTAYPNRQGTDYCRTSKDLIHWSPSQTVAFGGQSGTGQFSAECPHVVEARKGEFLLFRTQHYGHDALTSIYHSSNPMAFGANEDDKYFTGTIPIAAPEIVTSGGQIYIAALLPNLKGIQLAKIGW